MRNLALRLSLAAGIALSLAMLSAPASAQNEAVEACRDIWETVGIPEAADEDGEPVTVCHLGYVLGHSTTTKTPEWVIEHLTRVIAKGTNTRPGTKFSEETNLPVAIPRAVDKDYTGSGFDRGHQAPSNDFKSSRELMEDTFFLSNAVPQVGLGFNRGIWKDLEALVAKLAINRGEIYVITGPVNQEKRTIQIRAAADACGTAMKVPKPADKAIANGVAIPAALYKIIYDPTLGRLNAYLLPNLDHREIQDTDRDLDYLKRYRVGRREAHRADVHERPRRPGAADAGRGVPGDHAALNLGISRHS